VKALSPIASTTPSSSGDSRRKYPSSHEPIRVALPLTVRVTVTGVAALSGAGKHSSSEITAVSAYSHRMPSTASAGRRNAWGSLTAPSSARPALLHSNRSFRAALKPFATPRQGRHSRS
jgi:hypothetical protein